MRRLAPALLALVSLAACGSSTSEATEVTPVITTVVTGDTEVPHQVVAKDSIPETVVSTTPTVATATPVPFQMFTHCGVRGAMIDGIWWQATPELSDGNGNPPDGWVNGNQAGTLEYLDDSTAIFRSSDLTLTANLSRTDSLDYPFFCA